MIKTLFKSYFSNKEGATAVEFALIALPFLIMIFGIVEAGRIVWTMNTVQYAVEETARYAALNSEESDMAFQAIANDRLDGMTLSNTNLQITSLQDTSNGVNFIQIDGNYQVTMLFTRILPFTDFNFDTSVRRPIIE